MKQRRRGSGAIAAANDLGHTVIGGVRRDDQIVAVNQSQAAAETPAAHLGDGNLRELTHDVHDLGDTAEAAGPTTIVLAAHIVKIAAGGIRIAGASGNDTANVSVFGQRAKNCGNLGEERDAQGVFLFRPIERQPGNAGVFVDVRIDELGFSHDHSGAKGSNCSYRSSTFSILLLLILTSDIFGRISRFLRYDKEAATR